MTQQFFAGFHVYCVYHTYVSDCISKRVKVNNGERNKYYIENNRPAIIDAGTFARAQEEIARRSGKPKARGKCMAMHEPT